MDDAGILAADIRVYPPFSKLTSILSLSHALNFTPAVQSFCWPPLVSQAKAAYVRSHKVPERVFQHEGISWLRPGWIVPPLLLNGAGCEAVNTYSEEAAAGAITWRKGERT